MSRVSCPARPSTPGTSSTPPPGRSNWPGPRSASCPRSGSRSPRLVVTTWSSPCGCGSLPTSTGSCWPWGRPCRTPASRTDRWWSGSESTWRTGSVPHALDRHRRNGCGPPGVTLAGIDRGGRHVCAYPIAEPTGPGKPAHPRPTTGRAGSDRNGSRGREEFVPGAELDPGPALPLSRVAFHRIDRGPPVQVDQIRLPPPQPGLDLLRICGPGGSGVGGEVRRDRADGFCGALAVGPDDAAGTALDPARDVLAVAGDHPTVPVRDDAGARVERHPGNRDAPVADGPQHQPGCGDLPLAGVDRACRAVRAVGQPVAAQHDGFDPAVATNLDR